MEEKPTNIKEVLKMAKYNRGASKLYRSAITAVDALAVPANPALAGVATGGALTPGTPYYAAIVASNKYGCTTPNATIASADPGGSNNALTVPIAQVVGATHYDLFCSIDAAPKYLARITEAQRAAGGRIVAMGGPIVGDGPSEIAGKIRTALAANSVIDAFFTVSGTAAAVILTKKTKAANDATLNIAVADGTSDGVTTAATSANTTSGVAPVLQVETATIAGTITTAGNATITVTAAGMTGSPKAISVAVALSDDASAVAGKVRTALGLDADVIALFTVGGTGATVTLTKITAAANDATLNIASADGTCVGITAAANSANTTAGVAGTAQVETATVAGDVSTSGNVNVTVTATGLTGSPLTIPVAVTNVGGTAPGAIDVGVVGTGIVTSNDIFKQNTAFTPSNSLPSIDCTGKKKLYISVKFEVGDLQVAPTLKLLPFFQNSLESGNWHHGTIIDVVLLSAAGKSLEQEFELTVNGAQAVQLLVAGLTGTNASITIWTQDAEE